MQLTENDETTSSVVITLLSSSSSICPSLLPVLKGRVRHHGSVRPADGQHADVFLWLSARLLRHAVLPRSDQQPVRPAAAAPASGAPHGPAGALRLDQVRLHVQRRLR